MEGYERARNEWPWMGVMFVWHLRNPDGDPLEPATYFSILNQDFTPRPAYLALQDYSKVVPSTPTPQPKPLLNALGFPFLYFLFGLFSLAAFAFLGLSVGAWVRAALNRPRGLYTERTREIARNGAAVMGMVGFFALYYSARNLPIIAIGLAGYVLIAYFKPQAALALVAFSIPFFWYPKVYGSQHFPIAETMILLAFAALVARRATAFFLPGPGRASAVRPLPPDRPSCPPPHPSPQLNPSHASPGPYPWTTLQALRPPPSPEDMAVGDSEFRVRAVACPSQSTHCRACHAAPPPHY